ncbi:hypothetical protein ISS40_07905 [Candidatus Bathyarchaeota archaeon]|nr:hypothetical protein [Candidatus Bathyarchaeota archaeon]
MIEKELTVYRVTADIYIEEEGPGEAEELLAWLLFHHPHVIRETVPTGTRIVLQEAPLLLDVDQALDLLRRLD